MPRHCGRAVLRRQARIDPIQHTGMLYAMNAIRAVAIEHQQPICMMVGLLEKEPGVAPRDSKRHGIRLIEPILDVMGIAITSSTRRTISARSGRHRTMLQAVAPWSC